MKNLTNKLGNTVVSIARALKKPVMYTGAALGGAYLGGKAGCEITYHLLDKGEISPAVLGAELYDIGRGVVAGWVGLGTAVAGGAAAALVLRHYLRRRSAKASN